MLPDIPRQPRPRRQRPQQRPKQNALPGGQEAPPKRRTKQPLRNVFAAAIADGWAGAKADAGEMLAEGVRSTAASLVQQLMTRGIGALGGGSATATA